jgi:hypothetical protein
VSHQVGEQYLHHIRVQLERRVHFAMVAKNIVPALSESAYTAVRGSESAENAVSWTAQPTEDT